MSEQTKQHDLYINEIASYLYSYDPSLRKKLLADPEIDPDILDPGEEMGDVEKARVNRKVLLAQCKVIAESLDSAQARAKIKSDELQKKIVSLRKLRFIAAIGSTVTAGVTSISAALDTTAITLIASIATFIGTVANVSAATLLLGQNGTEAEVQSLIQDFEEARAYAEVSSKYLAAVTSGNYPVAEATVLVNEANKYFGRLVSALQKASKYVPEVGAEHQQNGGSTMKTANV